MKGFKFNSQTIANKLSIPEIHANEAVERLLRVGQLVKQNGQYKATNNFSTTTADIPIKAIKEQHSMLLDKAKIAIENRNVDERFFSSMIMSFEKHRLIQAKECIRKFQKEFNKKFTSETNSDDVVVLGINLFSLMD